MLLLAYHDGEHLMCPECARARGLGDEMGLTYDQLYTQYRDFIDGGYGLCCEVISTRSLTDRTVELHRKLLSHGVPDSTAVQLLLECHREIIPPAEDSDESESNE